MKKYYIAVFPTIAVLLASGLYLLACEKTPETAAGKPEFFACLVLGIAFLIGMLAFCRETIHIYTLCNRMQRDIAELRTREPKNTTVTEPYSEVTGRVAGDSLEVKLTYPADGDIATLAETVQKNVTELKRRIEYINHLAYIDPLTGISNSTAYCRALEELEHTRRMDQTLQFGLAVFDLNGLKEINDRLGHSMGDLFIKRAVEHIQTGFRACAVYRVGGDEFVALIFPPALVKLETMARRVQESLNEYNRTQTEFPEGISVAVGYARYDPRADEDCKSVFRRADEQMYRDKNRQKSAAEGGCESPKE